MSPLPPPPARFKRRPAMAAGIVTALLAAVALTAAHHPTRLVLPRAAAVRAALGDADARRALARQRWSAANVSALDSQTERVSFYDGGRIVAEVAVARDGTVSSGVAFARLAVPYGDWIAYEPAVLVGFGALFVLMAAVAPWRRLRNLDVAAALSLLAAVVLLQKRYLAGSVLAAAPGLLYLTLRCAWRALGAGAGAEAKAQVPLLTALTPRMTSAQRVRLLRALLAAMVLIYVMVGVSSTDPVDVVYAVMEGATKLIAGVLPYGHMPGDIVHGDTYPLFSYALYAPLAWAAPVRSLFDSVDVALGAAVAAGLLAALVVARGFSAGSRRAGEEPGLRAALAVLAFPALLVIVSTGTTDVPLGAMVALALLLWRRPALSCGLLAVAGWFKLAPFALLPARLAALRGRRLARAVAAVAAVCAVALALLLAVGGTGGPAAMIHALSFQFSRGSPQSLWAVLGLDRVQPLGEAAVLGLIAGAAVRLRRDPDLAADRLRMAALTAAILLGLQLAADYWAFLYLSWVAPALCLSLLAQQPTPSEATQRAAASSSTVRTLRPAVTR